MQGVICLSEGCALSHWVSSGYTDSSPLEVLMEYPRCCLFFAFPLKIELYCKSGSNHLHVAGCDSLYKVKMHPSCSWTKNYYSSLSISVKDLSAALEEDAENIYNIFALGDFQQQMFDYNLKTKGV